MTSNIPTKSDIGSAFLVWAMIAMLIIGHGMDVLTTVYAILALDAREANPLMKIFAHNPISLGAVKYYAMKWIYPPIFFRAKNHGILFPLFMHTVLIWCVVFWNLGVIVTKRRKHANTAT